MEQLNSTNRPISSDKQPVVVVIIMLHYTYRNIPQHTCTATSCLSPKLKSQTQVACYSSKYGTPSRLDRTAFGRNDALASGRLGNCGNDKSFTADLLP